jgi:hypothetical protein
MTGIRNQMTTSGGMFCMKEGRRKREEGRMVEENNKKNEFK